MATEKWSAPSAQVTVLSTQLNSLADAAYTALGAEVDNGTDLNRYALAQLDVTFGSAPNDFSPCELYMVPKADGTNSAYAAQPSPEMLVGKFILDNVTAQQLVVTAPFLLVPFKVKFLLRNASGQAFPATGSTVKLSTFNRAVA